MEFYLTVVCGLDWIISDQFPEMTNYTNFTLISLFLLLGDKTVQSKKFWGERKFILKNEKILRFLNFFVLFNLPINMLYEPNVKLRMFAHLSATQRIQFVFDHFRRSQCIYIEYARFQFSVKYFIFQVVTKVWERKMLVISQRNFTFH